MERFSKLRAAFAHVKNGGMLVVVDDESRENEGDLVMAAEHITPEKVNFMVREARGLVCVPMPEERADALHFPPMTTHNEDADGCNFAVSADLKRGVETGISAPDRSATILQMAAKSAKPADFVRPGHLFPLRARPGGVLVRAGHTEASVDIVRLAGCAVPVAVICEIMKDNGEMARLPELEIFAKQHGTPLVSIDELIEFRRQTESLVQRVGEEQLELPGVISGAFRAISLYEKTSGATHLALVHGDIQAAQKPPLVRVLAVSAPSPGSAALAMALGKEHREILRSAARLSREEVGVLVLVSHADMAAAEHQEHLRTAGVGAQILREVGVRQMRLLGGPARVLGLTGYGLSVAERLDFPPE